MKTAVVVVIIVIVAVALLIYRYYAAKKRREAFQAWARNRGWSYADRDDSFAHRFQGTPFGHGDHRQAKNVVQGRVEDRAVVAFDYSYETHSTDSKGNRQTQTHYFNVVAVGLPGPLPDLQVARESLLTSFGRALGFHDIELENEAFNKEFRISSDNRKLAYDVLHPRAMEFLLGADGPAWRIERADLLGWDKGKLGPAEIDRRIGFLCELSGQIPSFVWDNQGQYQ